MGKKGGTPKIEITKYFMSQHLGICAGTPDAITKITIKEKVAWQGEQTAAAVFVIDKQNLFGGREKEGGVEAVVYWQPGASDQVLPDLLAQKLGRANGADAPGYRGIASAWFVGPRGTPYANYSGWGESTEGRKGAYWSANSPYLPGIWITVRRAPVGLDPDIALIPINTVDFEASDLTWKWLEVATSDATDRSATGFDDSAWASGTFPFGNAVTEGSTPYPSAYGFSDTPATVIDPDSRYWIRTHLNLDAVPSTLIIQLYVDDDAVIYFNGVQVASVNVGDGYFHSVSVSTAALIVGDNVLAVRFTDTSAAARVWMDWRLVGAVVGSYDANPAHIIYECLTNTDWGMGSPATAIDFDSFEAAAVTLYNDGFGLSMIWTRQASIQDFIQEVLDHIQAVLFVDPATGLLTLKLVRGDYDVATLPIINPDNADLTAFSRKLWGEITNEIVVTWTNPENEQEETVTVQDLASIATQGGIISDSRNYYGVRYANLAAQLANRDLRSAGQPLASFEAEVDRTFWDARPADCVKVTWPEYGLDEVIARVTSVDYGKPGDPTVKLQLVEDVWGLDFGDYIEPPSSGWEDPSEAPAALTIERIFTLPLFFAMNSTSAAFIADPAYPQVLAGILATTTQDDAYGFELWDEVTLSNGSLEWQGLGTKNIIGHAELTDALVAETTSTAVTFDNIIGDTAPALAGFVIIGDGEESENEIAQFDAIGSDYTLRRGVLDTVPRAWPAGTPVWFVDEETVFEDDTVRSAGETVDVKLLTLTSRGALDLADAALVSHDLTERPWLPNRPANVQVEGVLFNTANTPVDMTARADPWVTISWANRNRLLEDSQVLAWDDATVSPETGQDTTIEVLADDGTTVLDTITGISGTSHDVPDASFGDEAIVLIRPAASRTDADGTFVSLQAHGIWVQVADGDYITEEGDNVITEDGDNVILEG